jgi:hypothetical protein
MTARGEAYLGHHSPHWVPTSAWQMVASTWNVEAYAVSDRRALDELLDAYRVAGHPEAVAVTLDV